MDIRQRCRVLRSLGISIGHSADAPASGRTDTSASGRGADPSTGGCGMDALTGRYSADSTINRYDMAAPTGGYDSYVPAEAGTSTSYSRTVWENEHGCFYVIEERYNTESIHGGCRIALLRNRQRNALLIGGPDCGGLQADRLLYRIRRPPDLPAGPAPLHSLT